MRLMQSHSRFALFALLTLGLCGGQQCATAPGNSIYTPVPQTQDQPQVTIETSLGNIVVELFPQQAPQTVASFLEYVDAGFYNGLIFHEVRAGQSIAAGGFTPDLQPKAAGDPIANESNNGLSNLRGRIAIVEPSGAGSATSRFLINLADNTSADFNKETGARGRTVFGRVVEGMSVADAIGALQTSSQTAGDGTTLANVPTNRQTIIRITRAADSPSEPTGDNQAPTAHAGSNRNIAPDITVTLNGSGSTDPDGDQLSYAWEQTAGATVALSNANTSQTTFTAPSGPGTYTFRLVVNDGRGGTASRQVTLVSVAAPSVRLETSLGDVVIQLLTSGAPATTRNFLQYVEDGYYNGTIFHRVMPGFVVQGGGFLPGLVRQSGTRGPVENEFGADRSNLRGTVAMAKIGGEPDSATSQFFFNLNDNSETLDPQNGGFTVFGRVVEGMNVVDDIAAVETSTQDDPTGNAFEDVPVTPVILERATIVSYTLPASFTTTPSGLQYRDLAIGTGDPVTPDSDIRVLYTGRLDAENGEVFDSSTDVESPATFTLSSLIAGWQEGLGEVEMHEGGKRVLIIPPELGYGDDDQGSIPPNSTLWFEIEVLEVLP